MKKTKLRLLLLLFFIGGLIILPQKAKAAEIIPVNISVEYGQTEARTILDMINEARTNSEYTWYWNMDDTTKTYCTDLKELKYDYDLERVAMKRAAEIALSYDHERPMGGYAWDTYKQENISYRYAGENIAAGQTTASQVNFGWREDDKTYAGQGHRRNMLSSDYNCVGIGHVYLYGKCSRCSKTITKQDAKNPALGHDWKDNGDGTATCSREGCGKKHTHDLDSGTTTVAPTCTATGEKEYCCIYANCPYKKTESLKATGHKNKETRNYKKPTCQEEGYTGDIYCKDCGILLSSGKVTKKYDHDWDGGKVTKEATCKEEGIMTYTCENCDKTETVSIKKTAHNYKIMEQKDATCTENGYSISACQTCNDKKKEEIVAKGHSKGIRNKKTATCKAEGYTGDTYCRTCNILLEEGKILPKLEHQWNDGTVTKRATYQTAGELTYRCRKCAAKRIISIEKLAYPKAGTSYTISGNEYKVSKPGAEVILVKTSKTTKNVTVPAQIYAQGITYKVTSIGAKAFNNNKKLTKVTIGTNIVKINSNAFFNCKNLKTVTIKSVRLTKKAANKKAFKNVHKKLVIRVPKKVKKIYKKIFKGLKVK